MEVRAKPHLHQDWIDSHAFGIVKALQKSGHETYLVGGCVRDLLINAHPKDFDIATAAQPQQVKRIIYMSFIIGKRFRLVLVKRDNQQFEVATFRREVRPEDMLDPNAPSGDNIFGTPEEDARRRDFTINGLFYDPVDEQLIDYVNGMPDIQARLLRMIGDPNVRLLEDSIRILRGLRLSHKLGFMIEPSLREAMHVHACELEKSVLPRRREEILKMLRLDEPDLALLECYDLGILKFVIPTLHDFLEDAARRELFLEHFNAYQLMVTDPTDTSQLFGWLVFAMLKAAHASPSERPEPLTIEDEIFQRLMRDELGMYKFEQTALMKALEILPSLEKTEDFKRRGERRQLSLMKNEGFRLAMTFAVADFQLSAEQQSFWSSAYSRLSSEILAGEADAKAAKKRRKPRKRRGAEGRGESRRAIGESAGLESEDSEDEDSGTDDSDDSSENDSDDVSPHAP